MNALLEKRVRKRLAFLVMLAWPVLLMAGCSGCGGASTAVGPGGPSEAEMVDQYQEEIFDNAIGNLNRLEEFHSGEMLQEVVERLNQWVQTQQRPADWTLDPMIRTLPEHLARLPMVADVEKLEFSRYDGLALQEAVWLRDVSKWARGSRLDELSRARQLFDWTVRNVQREAVPAAPDDQAGRRVGQLPWETLLFGRGTTLERAWVFVLLARQQRIDAAVLALADPDDPAGKPPQPWLVGVLIGEAVYLFDPALGVPIPASGGVRFDEAGQLDVLPATLAEVIADDALLRQLDVDQAHSCPVKSADLARLVVLVEGSPPYLALRMRLIETHPRLAGDQKVVLTTRPTAQAERWKRRSRLADVRFWTYPYETLRQHVQLSPEQVQRRLAAIVPFQIGPAAALWKGRVLHLKGNLAGEKSATYYYQMARPSNRELAHLAAQYYESKRTSLESLPEGERARAEEQLKLEAMREAHATGPLFLRAKQDASYWLGLIAFDRKNYRSAINYFIERTLEASPDGPWTHGAKYNLARSFEASLQYEKAIEVYRADATSPAYHGNLLRAKWLQSQQPEVEAPKPEPGMQEPDAGVPQPEAEIPQPDAGIPEPESDVPQPGTEPTRPAP